jgi:hypothetical protein
MLWSLFRRFSPIFSQNVALFLKTNVFLIVFPAYIGRYNFSQIAIFSNFGQKKLLPKFPIFGGKKNKNHNIGRTSNTHRRNI